MKTFGGVFTSYLKPHCTHFDSHRWDPDVLDLQIYDAESASYTVELLVFQTGGFHASVVTWFVQHEEESTQKKLELCTNCWTFWGSCLSNLKIFVDTEAPLWSIKMLPVIGLVDAVEPVCSTIISARLSPYSWCCIIRRSREGGFNPCRS